MDFLIISAFILFYPFLALFLIPIINKNIVLVALGFFLITGCIFTYFSTIKGLTFENNIFDLLIIHLFLFSLYGCIVLIVNYLTKNKWILYISLFVVTLLNLKLYFSAFGPSEACGQTLNMEIYQINSKYKITHSGYQYGFTDYGSRFILYKKKNNGLESILGIAENANYFYGSIDELNYESKNDIIQIKYNTYNNVTKLDTIQIQKNK